MYDLYSSTVSSTKLNQFSWHSNFINRSEEKGWSQEKETWKKPTCPVYTASGGDFRAEISAYTLFEQCWCCWIICGFKSYWNEGKFNSLASQWIRPKEGDTQASAEEAGYKLTLSVALPLRCLTNMGSFEQHSKLKKTTWRWQWVLPVTAILMSYSHDFFLECSIMW